MAPIHRIGMSRRRDRPKASSPTIRRVMQSIGRTNTPKERELRSLLHRAGLRYRVHAKPVLDVNRRADIVFPSCKVAVFVDGCFWHACPLHSHVPKTNTRYWRSKLDWNRARDDETNVLLRVRGWVVLRYWEHCDMAAAAAAVERVVRSLQRRREKTSGRTGESA